MRIFYLACLTIVLTPQFALPIGTMMGNFSPHEAIRPVCMDKAAQNKVYQVASKAYSSLDGLYKTYEIAYQCIHNKVEGDFVECGVAHGAQSALLAFACERFNANKKVHLFDSFQGIPLASAQDERQPGIAGPITHNTNVNPQELLVSSGIDIHPVTQVKNNMKSWNISEDYLVYHKGWFQDSLPKVSDSIDKICFLRLDGDLYESTKVCLEYLYDKVVPGGYILLDDFSLPGSKKALDEFLEKRNINPEFKVVPNSWQASYWIKD